MNSDKTIIGLRNNWLTPLMLCFSAFVIRYQYKCAWIELKYFDVWLHILARLNYICSLLLVFLPSFIDFVLFKYMYSGINLFFAGLTDTYWPWFAGPRIITVMTTVTGTNRLFLSSTTWWETTNPTRTWKWRLGDATHPTLTSQM